MGVSHIILRNSENFKGIDKRSSDLQRTMEYATDVKNAAFRVSGAINKRKGYHSSTLGSPLVDEPSYGTFSYRVADTDGRVTEKVLLITNKLYEVKECYVQITNNRTSVNINPGEDEDILVANYLNKINGQFVFKISNLSNNINYYEENLSTGKLTADINLETLINNINNEPNLNLNAAAFYVDGGAVTATDLQNTPAAFIDIASETVISASNSVNINFRVLESKETDNGDVTIPNETNIFPAFLSSNTYAQSDLVENISAVQLNNVMYFSNGQDPVMKYDGTNVYRAGLPGLVETVIPGSWAYEIGVDQTFGNTSGNIVINRTVSAGTPVFHANDVYFYKFVIEYTDAQGNLVQSQPSDPIKYTVNTDSDSIDITWNPVIFDKLNKNSNLKVQIYKTVEGTTTNEPDKFGLYYLVDTVTWDSQPDTNSSTNYYDTSVYITGATENLEFLRDPVKRRDPPPKGRYLTTFQNCLVISGQNENVNNLQYSHPGGGTTGEIGSEYFPDDDNGTIVESSFGDRITGIAALRDLLYIFHRNSIHVLGGDITAAQGAPYSVELLTKEGGIGCTSFASIVEFRSQLLFLSESGMYSIDSSNALSEISELIKPFFQDIDLVKQRAISFNWTDQNLIIIHIPKESTSTGGDSILTSNDNSIILAYDTYKNAWLKWDGLNFSGGIVFANNSVFFTSREISSAGYASYSISKFSNTGTTYDYSDHESPINFEYETNWESLKDPTVPKKFLRVKLYAMDTDNSFESPGFDLDVAVQKDFFNYDIGIIPFDFGGGRDEIGWGFDPWGNHAWGGPPNQFFKSKLPSGKSRCLKLRFSNNNLLENVLITNYELEIAAPFAQEIKE